MSDVAQKCITKNVTMVILWDLRASCNTVCCVESKSLKQQNVFKICVWGAPKVTPPI